MIGLSGRDTPNERGRGRYISRKKACFKVAEAAGAQSFAHANSVLGSQMAAQALLVLHGYPQIKKIMVCGLTTYRNLC